jgi:hypothetical protein
MYISPVAGEMNGLESLPAGGGAKGLCAYGATKARPTSLQRLL